VTTNRPAYVVARARKPCSPIVATDVTPPVGRPRGGGLADPPAACHVPLQSWCARRAASDA
jgi:hypothetical protein